MSGETLSEIQQKFGKPLGYWPWRGGTFGMKDYLDMLHSDNLEIIKKEKQMKKLTKSSYYASFMNSLAGCSGTY